MSHDRTSSTDFAEIAITACCLKVGSQDRIESTPQSRTTSAKETGLCSSNDITAIWRSFLGQPLVEKSTWSVFVPVLCDIYLLALFVVTVAGKIETICGNKRHVLCFLAHFATKFLGHSFKRLLQHIKFIHSHEPNFSITRSDCSRSFRKFASWTHIQCRLFAVANSTWKKLHVQCKYGLLQ